MKQHIVAQRRMRVAVTILEDLVSQTSWSFHRVRGRRGQIIRSRRRFQDGAKLQIEGEISLRRVFVFRSLLAVMMSDLVGELDGKPQAPSFTDNHALQCLEDSLKRYA